MCVRTEVHFAVAAGDISSHWKCSCLLKWCQAVAVAGEMSTSRACVKMLPCSYITAFVYSSRCNFKHHLYCSNFAVFRSLHMKSENLQLWNLPQVLWRILCVSLHFLRAICLWKYLNNTCSWKLFWKHLSPQQQQKIEREIVEDIFLRSLNMFLKSYVFLW
jgi:hypothetical protein